MNIFQLLLSISALRNHLGNPSPIADQYQLIIFIEEACHTARSDDFHKGPTHINMLIMNNKHDINTQLVKCK